ncbi:tetratricopeptide repeat protein [Aurantivibrio plasticivorans]
MKILNVQPSSHRLTVKRSLLATAIAASVLLSGCSWLAGPEDEYIGDTLSELEPARMPDMDVEVPKIALEEIEENYHRALDVASDDEVRRKILIRLAGLQMIRSEQNQLDATEPGQHFTDAISMYNELIELQAGRPGRDKLLYQLSKAYALEGMVDESAATLDRLAMEYPDSPYIAEAQFRRAERAFSANDYAAAESFYSSVADAQQRSPFQNNATYMLGWSQFKRSRYVDAIDSFTRVLDDLMMGRSEIGDLEESSRNLAEDTLRVMSLTFSYLDGARSIYDTYPADQERAFNHLIYERLGNFYLEKKRYRDAADTYSFYVEKFPNSDYAPRFSARIIDVYDEGDFPSLLLPAKQDFVNNYGIRSQFWASKPVAIQDSLLGYLHVYLEELAKYEHSQAQAAAKPPEKELSNRELKKRQEESVEHYAAAARYYEEFIETFPQDEKTPNMVFLLGESYYESGQLANAVAAYERVAYEFLDEKQGAEAGYSAILALNELIEANAGSNDPAKQEAHAAWQIHHTNSSISFADYYPDDERAPKVLAQGAQQLLAQGENVRAIDAATRLTVWQPALDGKLQKTAWLVIGQAQFDLAAYAESEYAYRQVLAMMPAPQPGQPAPPVADGPTRAQVIDRIAANMFKQAEQQLALENKAGAVDQLLAISQLSPGTDIAISAEYDAATYLMDLERWSEAEQVLVRFRNNYPTHELAKNLSPKLVVIYQALEQWQAAANELSVMAQNDSDPDVRRQSKFLAAELYEQSGNLNNAILAYRDYANNYREPFPQMIEAQYKLVELYGKTGDMGKRRYWQNEIIKADARAGAARTDRSRYLAAEAHNEKSDELYQTFVSIPLNLPLKKSLDRKRTALDRALKSYETLIEYGVADFATQANYRIGQIYVQLSQDLLNSERPKDLDELALEQYTILLEEQAYPFEEQAIEIHEANAQRSWDGVYDNWVKDSFAALAKLLPARYNKKETVVEYDDAIH